MRLVLVVVLSTSCFSKKKSRVRLFIFGLYPWFINQYTEHEIHNINYARKWTKLLSKINGNNLAKIYYLIFQLNLI